MDKQLKDIAENTLLLLNKKSWNSIQINDVVKKLPKNRKKILKKHDLLKNINKYIDYKLKVSLGEINNSNQKDLIFEVIMSRFDILQNYRKSIINIYDSFKQKPKDLILLLPSFLNSMILIANLANVHIKGLTGNLKIKGLLIIYFSSFLIWINDDSPSLDKTMTSVDLYLNRANSVFKIYKE